MSALVVVGIALAAFGSLVLLKFPDRPGGKIAWRGAEVSSAGAGLPLIVLGVATVVLAVVLADGDARDDGASTVSTQSTTSLSPPSSDGSTSKSTMTPTFAGCFRDYFAPVPADRVGRVEDGAQNLPVISATVPKEQPIGLLLTKLEQPIGAAIVRFISSGGFFRVLSVVDAACRPVEDFMADDSSDKHIVRNWNTLRIALAGRFYSVSLGGNEEYLEVDFYESS
jgi:hypothetical protein